MKQHIKILIAGLAIIIVTNVVALGGVAYNRSGEPDAVIELTERELSIPYNFFWDNENTGLSLELDCQDCRGNPDWFDRDKLIELGFEPSAYPEDDEVYSGQDENDLSRGAYLVLEFDGKTHKRAVETALKYLVEKQAQLADTPDDEELKAGVEYAESELYNEKNSYSRLYAIDAGIDRVKLREAYPDGGKYIIVQAQISQSWEFAENDKKKWVGHIEGLLIESVNIPLEYRTVFDGLEKPDSYYEDVDNWLPGYKATIAFGKRLEPWVIAVERLVSGDQK